MEHSSKQNAVTPFYLYHISSRPYRFPWVASGEPGGYITLVTEVYVRLQLISQSSATALHLISLQPEQLTAKCQHETPKTINRQHLFLSTEGLIPYLRLSTTALPCPDFLTIFFKPLKKAKADHLLLIPLPSERKKNIYPYPFCHQNLLFPQSS